MMPVNMPPGIAAADAAFPKPFASKLEFNPPARGVWNIVHTGMLMPESHQIFVCARGCLRGVILTAAEMNAMDRMSWVSVGEREIVSGKFEENIIEGVSGVIRKLKSKPRAILIFISCIQQFAGCDFEYAVSVLRERFPELLFADCYMNPVMRKSGLTPDQLMRRQLYKFLEKTDCRKRSVNIIGSDYTLSKENELYSVLEKNGYEVRQITECKSFSEYLKMSESALNITLIPAAKASADALEKRLGIPHLHFPACYSRQGILENYSRLADALNVELPDFTEFEQNADSALRKIAALLGKTQVEIDYSAVSRPLGLARLLTEYGINVTRVYSDVYSEDERRDFEALKSLAPDLILSPVTAPEMRYVHGFNAGALAIGQKAAFFCGTKHFVNTVFDESRCGFYALKQMAELIKAAYLTESDTEMLIQHKGLGCESCL